MTTAETTISPASIQRRLASTPALLIAIAVQILAVFSAFTDGFEKWIEFRFTQAPTGVPRNAIAGIWAWPENLSAPSMMPVNLHWLAIPVQMLLWSWVVSVLVAGRAPKVRGLRAVLVLPSLVLAALLSLNTIYYYRLYALGRLDSFQIPITLFAALLLVSWIVTTLRDRGEHIVAQPSSKRRTLRRTGIALYAATLLAFAFWFFGFAFADNPPPVRLAAARPRLGVVLGNYARPDGLPGQVMGDRVLTAIDLYRAGEVQILLLSGACSGQDGTGPNEPAAMKKLCIAAGIPEDAIYLDPVGINTRASVESTQQLLAQLNPLDVVAISSPSHLPRVRLAYAQAGLPISTVAARPTVWGPQDLTGTVREIYALAVYRLNPSYRPAIGVAMNVSHPRLVVTKSKNTVELYDGERLVKTYPCITGRNEGDKEVEGDKKTPLGLFHIVYRNPESKFHLSLGLDYPNAEDCQRGIKAGLITQRDADDILAAAKSDLRIEANQNRLWKSPLGGEIFIHGHAEGRENTAGCVALSNPGIEELYAICAEGTEVEIRE